MKYVRTKIIIAVIIAIMMTISAMALAASAADANTYQLLYDANGGAGAPPAKTVVANAYTNLSTVKPVFPGQVFLGWVTELTSGSTRYQPGEWIYVDKDITLYAVWDNTVWQRNYTVSFNYTEQSGGVICWAPEIAAGSSVFDIYGDFNGWELTDSQGVVWSSKWYLDEARTKLYDFHSPVTDDIELFALWQRVSLFILSYDANGGAGAPPAKTVVPNAYTNISLTAPVRSGYTFLGWNTYPVPTVPTSARYQPGGWIYIDEDTVLRAVWNDNEWDQCIVSFNYTEKSGWAVWWAPVILYGENISDIYGDFNGWEWDDSEGVTWIADWYTDPDFSQIYDFGAPVKSSFTLYAKWVRKICLHEWGLWTVTLPATCVAEGEMIRECLICGETELESIDIDPDNHVGDTYESLITTATCSVEGVMGIYCEDCDALLSTRNLGLDPDNHVGDTYESLITTATCCVEGIMGIYCEDCDALLSTRNLGFDPDNHVGDTYESLITTATCCEEGVMGIYCEDCNALLSTRNLGLDPDNHVGDTYESLITTATCCVEGVMGIYCEDCNALLSTRNLGLDPDNHIGDTYESLNTTATCCVEGVMGIYCEDCNALLSTRNLGLDPDNHTGNTYESLITTATCCVEGIMGIYCEDCGALLGTRNLGLDPDNHVGGTHTDIIAIATCYSLGEVGIYCDDCDELISTYEIPMIDHVLDRSTIVTVDGEQGYKCVNYDYCGHFVSLKDILTYDGISVSRGGSGGNLQAAVTLPGGVIRNFNWDDPVNPFIRIDNGQPIAKFAGGQVSITFEHEGYIYKLTFTLNNLSGNNWGIISFDGIEVIGVV